MLSTNNILKPSDGKPIVVPTQDMVIGIYYLTMEKQNARGEGRVFTSPAEAKMAYQIGDIELQARIEVRMTKEIDGVRYSKRIKTTVGRIIFNEALPQDLGIVPRETPEQQLDLEVDYLVGKKQLSQIVERCFKQKGSTEVAKVLDRIKALGFKFSTIGAITTSVFDMQVPSLKQDILREAEEAVLKVEKSFRRGELTEEERYKDTIKIWEEATNAVEKNLEENFRQFDRFNPIWMMADSGARGSMQQIKQLSGMRGLMNDPTGKVIEIPVKSSFREGLSVLEYFISSHGARKGGADTAIKTADSGYLTRRLVDVAHDVTIREEDCGDKRGFVVRDIYDQSGRLIEDIAERMIGRYSIGSIANPKTGEVIVPEDTMITEEMAKAIKAAGIKEVRIRSVLSCKAKLGVCSKCYGANMASWNAVKVGEAVGIIAAQSIGEPGTQLTMRTFHTGGVATSGDITQGLPRVVELFEARRPKGEAVISDIKGIVTLREEERQTVVTVTGTDTSFEYKIPIAKKLLVKNGQLIEAGDPITDGSVNPQEILRTKGVQGVQEAMIREVQSAYRSNGVHINDKHIEIIVRQMLRKVRINEPNDTDLLMNELVDINRIEEENERVLAQGGVTATANRVLLGISKAALATESFLSAASFQETARVLTDAAIKAKTDHLIGLKENVIIGKLIPAGTGLKIYRNINIEKVEAPKPIAEAVATEPAEFEDYYDSDETEE